MHGFLARVGEHTVTGIWQAARLGGVFHHSRAHEFFARRAWSPDALGLALAGLIVERFLAPGAAIPIAVDATLFRRSGPRVFAAGWHYDAAATAGRKLRFGNLFVCLGILVRLPGVGERTVCLALLFRLWRAGQKTELELAHELVALLAGRFRERRLELVADGACATRALAALPANVTACVRLRSNAALYEPAPERRGRRGRPRKRGARIGTPAQLVRAPGRRWRLIEFERAGARERAEVLVLDCLWAATGERPVRVIVARDPARPTKLALALLSTATAKGAAEILARYGERWAIAVAFQDAKSQLGVGEARNRVRRAVERTVPFGFLCQTLTLVWYALNGEPALDLARRRRAAPWYRQKRRASFSDMLVALRRELIVAEFRAQALRAPLRGKNARLREPPQALAG